MNLNYLKDKLKNSLLELLQIYEEMFDGTLGSKFYHRIKARCKALSYKAFSYSKIHEPILKKEVNRLIK